MASVLWQCKIILDVVTIVPLLYSFFSVQYLKMFSSTFVFAKSFFL